MRNISFLRISGSLATDANACEFLHRRVRKTNESTIQAPQAVVSELEAENMKSADRTNNEPSCSSSGLYMLVYFNPT